MEEVVGVWKRLHIEELHNLYLSPNIIRMIKSRRMRRAVNVACVGDVRNYHKSEVGISEGKRKLGRPRHR